MKFNPNGITVMCPYIDSNGSTLAWVFRIPAGIGRRKVKRGIRRQYLHFLGRHIPTTAIDRILTNRINVVPMTMTGKQIRDLYVQGMITDAAPAEDE